MMRFVVSNGELNFMKQILQNLKAGATEHNLTVQRIYVADLF